MADKNVWVDRKCDADPAQGGCQWVGVGQTGPQGLPQAMSVPLEAVGRELEPHHTYVDARWTMSYAAV